MINELYEVSVDVNGCEAGHSIVQRAFKSLSATGFKSYRSQEKFDDFHPRTNVLVGRNGSGKSNIILAIRFVLGADMQHISTEERKKLIHQGKENVASGYVEIVFDNSDKRFPVDGSEVRLRRIITLSKTDYLLNGKHVTADDVFNLLESAGLSRSNPYYIVQQGKISALAKMKPEERLEVLREVAGTKVYDERKEESLKIMEDTKGKKDKIEEMMNILDERLKELDAEKTELDEYQELDKTRRALEFTIYTKELLELSAQLQQLDDTHNQEVNDVSAMHKQSAEVHDRVKALEKEAKSLAIEIEKLSSERSLLLSEREHDLTIKTRLELELQSLDSAQSDQAARYKDIDSQIKQLDKEITKAQKTLTSLTEKFHAALSEESDLKERALDHERRIRELHSRQGRSAQFKTVKERDDWIDKEVSSLIQSIRQKKEQQKKFEIEINSAISQIKEEKEKLSKKSSSTDDFRKQLEQLDSNKQALAEKREQAANRRKELWRRDREIRSNIQILAEDINKHERQLYASLSKEQSQGLEAVKRMKAERPSELQGVYAPLIELFQCTAEEMTAIETTAKGQLFNVVVDTDETAARLLELLNQERGGRVTFMPLNKLNVKETKYPRTETAVPIVDRLKFKPLYRKAFLQVFGRTLLCSTLEEAAQISHQHNVDCVTLDGDEVSRKGALSGGFTDKNRSRLAAMTSLRLSREEYDSKLRESEEIEKDLEKIEALVTKCQGQIEEIDRKRTELRHGFESFSMESSAAQKNILAIQSQQHRLESGLTTIAQELHQLEESERSLRAEKGSKLVSKLTSDEDALLHSLTGELVDFQKSLAELSNVRAQTQALKSVEENRLTQNLLAKLRELERERSSISIGEDERHRLQVQNEVSALSESIAQVNQRLGKLDEDISDKTKAQDANRRNLDEAREIESEHLKQLQGESGAIDKALGSRSVLLQKKDEAQRKLREVGSLALQTQKMYEKQKMPQLVKQLHDIRKKLKEFSHINKKALDQYIFFKEQREELVNRKDELDKSQQAIGELIDALDKKKNEAIVRTFKMVAKYFEEVFTELTQQGEASLVMQTREDEGEEEDGDRERPYSGVDIQVSFTKSGKKQRMQQYYSRLIDRGVRLLFFPYRLSGGQQSLVALSLVFAIQRCDPAPFYVFDEIDAALDDTHRLSVAEMIEKQSDKTQFILTSHRPEMVQHAHKHYLIQFKNKVSTIRVCEMEEALEVVQQAATAPGASTGPRREGPSQSQEPSMEFESDV